MALLSMLNNSKELTFRGRERSLSEGGSHIHSFVFTDHNNNRFQKKFMMQNTDLTKVTHLANTITAWCGVVVATLIF